MAASDHLAPEQLKLFLPHESAQNAGMTRMNTNRMVQRQQDWGAQHPHTVASFLRGKLAKHGERLSGSAGNG